MPQLELKLTLKIDVPDAAAASFYIDTQSGEASLDIIADMFDIATEFISDPVLEINGQTHQQIKQAMQTRVP